ncbi:unnamed protein product [Urochloa decumbens]|uniref:AB hydrolase-1 domain-containing protein n=1 Tax=Urochloa decumbens TaxID=240449 RepID=A0ABC9GRJ7_9POAL
MRRWSTWPRAAAGAASSALAAAVFAFLDVLDVALCLVYALVDGILEESPARCYCHIRSPPDDDEEVSDTLYARRSAVRDALLGLVRVATKTRTHRHRAPPEKPRWSDCGCKSCVAWRSGAGRLHVVAKEPDKPNKDAAGTESDETATAENNAAAIFVHGFTSSSSLWAETVFRESSVLSNTKLFAVDLLGFGQSPKPADCLYRLRDHVEAIETSLIEHNNLSSFHLVAHSMGCIIALALAAKHPHWVKSITLVAPVTLLFGVRAVGEPGRAEQAGGEEAVAAVAVRFSGDVVVRARRPDGVLAPLQEPPALGVALHPPHKEEGRGLPGAGPDQAHPPLRVAHHAQRHLRRGQAAGPPPGGRPGRRHPRDARPRRRRPRGAGRVQQPSSESQAPPRRAPPHARLRPRHRAPG